MVKWRIYSCTQGPAGVRHLVSSLPERGDYPFLACLLSLRKDKTFATSKWVGGGNLDGHVAFKASVLFPAAKKDLQLSMKVDLAAFDFPLSGSNFSGYREAPREVALTPFFLEGGKQRVLDWAQAKKEGCGDFCLRLVVVPISVSEVMVQVGAVPFTLDHLKQEYKEVYDEAFFSQHVPQGDEAEDTAAKGRGQGVGGPEHVAGEARGLDDARHEAFWFRGSPLHLLPSFQSRDRAYPNARLLNGVGSRL